MQTLGKVSKYLSMKCNFSANYIKLLTLLHTRVYSSFTMETILATAFGRVINFQKGESDSLFEAVSGLFELLNESSETSASNFIMILSKSSSLWLLYYLLLSMQVTFLGWNQSFVSCYGEVKLKSILLLCTRLPLCLFKNAVRKRSLERYSNSL